MVYNGCMNIIRPFDNEIVVVEDFLSQAEADFVLELATGDPKLWDGSNDGSGLKEWYGNQLRVDPQNLNDRYQEYKDFFNMLQERSKPIFSKEYGLSEFYFLPINSVSRRIGPGLGVHTDEISPQHPQYNPLERIITHGFVVYINDEYEGGEIFYPQKNLSIKPKALSLVMHPGNKEYEHGVNEVLKTTRYSLSWWTR
jgi:hypothetical protein